ncbi:hypothetical protein TIFTF001_001491 [Ficus carica]|uniref:Exostosin GT47 domain-containing protein n=1 Tax=Ficus carica TaxID=3494 RepID=A0AA88CRC1_FICCA|nr:hypothetical protein TIFTF001_001491 [Ficus carica]
MSPTFSTSAAFVALPIIPLLALLLLFFSHNSGLATFSSSSSSSSSSATSEFWRNFGNNASSAANNLTASLSAYQLAPAKAPRITFRKKPDYSCNTSSSAPAASPIGEAGDNRDTKLITASSSLRKLEAKLVEVRASIREAALFARNNSTPVIINHTTSTDHDYSESDQDYVPKGHIYRNPSAFHGWSYLEMEKLMKIYVYEEGERPLFHDGPCRSIYSMEGRFIHEIEKGLFRTRDPNKAVVYFLPFSVVKLVQFLYARDLHDKRPMRRVVIDYVKLLAHKHPFWNRSLGADHFMLSCHDWGPSTSSVVPHLYHRSIRALCNANTLEGFRPSKDVSIPEINLEKGEIRGLGGPSPSTRTILAFFAGHLHGYTGYLLLSQWKNKDPDVQVYEQLPRQLSYQDMMRKSKFCLCPSGYEVASPRVVEAIYAECVPVLISDGYVPPFSDVLNWKSFSLQITVTDIPNIKQILMGISTRHYLRLQRRVKMVQRHFVVNSTPLRYDVLHMILHSVWLRRLNVRFQDTFSSVTHSKLFHNQTNQNQ